MIITCEIRVEIFIDQETELINVGRPDHLQVYFPVAFFPLFYTHALKNISPETLAKTDPAYYVCVRFGKPYFLIVKLRENTIGCEGMV